MLTPVEVGLPAKFRAFRQYAGFDQFATALRLARNPANVRVSALYAPPGAGKSITYMAAALLRQAAKAESRALVLVGTKGLQTQLIDDFAPIGLARVWGHRNYPCSVQIPGISPDDPEFECLQPNNCQHKRDIEAANASRLVVANYAYWMTIARYGHPDLLGEFDLLVLDEVHTAPTWLTDFVAVTIYRRAVRDLLGCDLPAIDSADVQSWSRWAAEMLSTARAKYRLSKTQRLKILGMDLATLAGVGGFGPWKIPLNTQKESAYLDGRFGVHSAVPGEMRQSRDASSLPVVRGLQHTDATTHVTIPPLTCRPYRWIGTELPRRDGVRFTPIWGAQYAERYLFRGIERIIACSGTLSPGVLTRIGIGPDDAEYIEVPSPFPAERRPVLYVPTCRIQHDMTEAQKAKAMLQLDRYIESRLPTGRGLIHTRSYAWAREIMMRSRHADVMTSHHDSAGLPSAIRALLDPRRKCQILVSPSIEEGYNFPDDDARWQVIWKCLVGDSRDPLHKARIAADSEYRYAQTTESILQIAGRIVRSDADWGETLIIDDHWQHVRKQYFPQWFRDAWKWYDEMPTPMRQGDV